MDKAKASAGQCDRCGNGKSMRGETLCWKCYRDKIRSELGRSTEKEGNRSSSRAA